MARARLGVFIALLRAVNVGGTGVIRMADLKATCEGIGFRDVTTLLQSGNVVFRAAGSDATVAKKLADAIEAGRGFRPAIVVRTAKEIADAMCGNPFKAEETSDPSHLIVAFTATPPTAGASERIAAVKIAKERLRLGARELYVHYDGGQGTSKVTNAALERALGTPVTARNWNTVGKLLALARALD
jgi:uncharacterized protein (DUF1697 family)